MSAIAHYHLEAGLKSPYDESIQRYLTSARRHLKEGPSGKKALTYELLRKVVQRFPANTTLGIRNRAMVLLDFASGWRRSEIVALGYSDVRLVPEGLELWQRASKVDQTGEGRLVGIRPGKRRLTCPIRALRAWLEVRGHWRGPLFVRIHRNGTPTREGLEPRGSALHQALKRALAEVGEDASEFGAHSLRAGMVTEAAKHGASESAIMMRTGHKSSQTLRRYIRASNRVRVRSAEGRAVSFLCAIERELRPALKKRKRGPRLCASMRSPLEPRPRLHIQLLQFSGYAENVWR